MQLSAIKTAEGTFQSCRASCAGQQSSEGSQHSPSHAGGLPGKLSKPSRYRATTDGVPQSIEGSAPGLSLGSSEAGEDHLPLLRAAALLQPPPHPHICAIYSSGM